MEKLIELLNEYNEGGHWRDENFDRNKLLVISKKYGFVKWLIDNYYIELPMGLWVVKSYDKELGLFNYFSDYESLLMLLSISDEPIKFLISILK